MTNATKWSCTCYREDYCEAHSLVESYALHWYDSDRDEEDEEDCAEWKLRALALGMAPEVFDREAERLARSRGWAS